VSRLIPIDMIILGYVSVVSIVALARAPNSTGTWWLVLANTLIVLLVILVTRPGLGRMGRLVREIYPILLLTSLYGALDILNVGRGTNLYDPVVLGWENWLFGGQISREWWQMAPSRLWSTIFHGSYLAYYLIIPLPPLYFAAKGNQVALRRSVLLITTAFVVCYLFFIFFPVAGPYYQFPRPTGTFVDNPMAQAVYGILATGSSYGAAFPSSHVAATVAAVVAAWWGAPRLGLILAIPTALLTIGVVYTQMHYGVDALAGLIVAALVVTGTWLVETRTSPGVV
jgi:membrane-associated phospholipid phosphatase